MTIQKSDARDRLVNRLRFFNKRVTNRITMAFAGRRVFAVMHHVGRRSGQAYTTPVLAMPTEDGVVIPLPYSEQADWCQNILTAGSCQMQWKGRMYTLTEPRLIEPSQSLPYFPRWLRRSLRHTNCYLRLKTSLVG